MIDDVPCVMFLLAVIANPLYCFGCNNITEDVRMYDVVLDLRTVLKKDKLEVLLTFFFSFSCC